MLLLKYTANNKFTAAIAFYLLFSTVLKAVTDIDICIPCLWKSLFNLHCPGCGLTTAFISILKLNFKNAYETNWLIFVIVPVGIYYITQDFIKFRRKYNKKSCK